MNPPSQDPATVLDLSRHPLAQDLVRRCSEFFDEVQNQTPGKELERKLNRDYGPGTPYYDDFCRMIKQGLEEGWVAATEVDGKRYRRGKISIPTPDTRFFSITAVYMNSAEEDQRHRSGDAALGVYRGQYHTHPYGEINCVVQLDDTAELMGMSGWQGAGWTSPGPGTHHYPEVRRGALVALFFLPAGRISYDAQPGMPQPVSV